MVYSSDLVLLLLLVFCFLFFPFFFQKAYQTLSTQDGVSAGAPFYLPYFKMKAMG